MKYHRIVTQQRSCRVYVYVRRVCLVCTASLTSKNARSSGKLNVREFRTILRNLSSFEMKRRTMGLHLNPSSFITLVESRDGSREPWPFPSPPGRRTLRRIYRSRRGETRAVIKL